MKRSRQNFESDLQAQQSPFVIYGTPLPPLDPDVRDDGSYVPVWKQEVTDEKGRKRLHGAFTGGFSAGYFNTVGSKEGWNPSTFVSSRSQKRKDAERPQQRPEDFMDEEDLAEAEESRELQTADTFAGLGSRAAASANRDPFEDLFRPVGENVGVKLLKKMGWREGEGIGPKVVRAVKTEGEAAEGSEPQLVAPQNSPMVSFNRKTDRKGLGYAPEQSLQQPAPNGSNPDSAIKEENEGRSPPFLSSKNSKKSSKTKADVRGGFGMGVLNDTGSDDEDPYAIGPQISYSRTLGGDKKKKKKIDSSKSTANPLVNNKPIFVSKKKVGIHGNPGFRQCHDGRLPIDGFVLSSLSDSLASILSLDAKYSAPEVPADWVPSKERSDGSQTFKAENKPTDRKLDPRSRATLLGEAPLPSKSVFDFLTPAARSKIATATSNDALPPARGEASTTKPLTTPGIHDIRSRIPRLPNDTAVVALGRGTAGWVPYTDNPSKRNRYVRFLECNTGLRGDDALPDREPHIRDDDWIAELEEFAHAATIFKPMSAAMASRFTTSSSSVAGPRTGDSDPTHAGHADEGGAGTGLLRQPKGKTPAEEAAAMGMYGHLTRSVENWFPTRLLCKRFNVKPPSHAQLDPGDDASAGKPTYSTTVPQKRLELLGKREMDELKMAAGGGGKRISGFTSGGHEGGSEGQEGSVKRESDPPAIDPEMNEAIEKQRPGEEIFRAIFGSDSDDE